MQQGSIEDLWLGGRQRTLEMPQFSNNWNLICAAFLKDPALQGLGIPGPPTMPPSHNLTPCGGANAQTLLETVLGLQSCAGRTIGHFNLAESLKPLSCL